MPFAFSRFASFRALLWTALLTLPCLVSLLPQPAHAQTDNVATEANEAADPTSSSEPIEWLSGPFTARVSQMATVNIPAGYLFADTSNTRRFLEACEVRVTGAEIAMVRPANEKLDWYVVFEFADEGYVDDEESESIDSKQMLQALKQINEEENTVREQLGWSTTEILDWEKSPAYNATNNNLEWALRIQRDDLVDINYNTRALGRFGVMVVNLVVAPEDLPDVLPIYRSLIDSFRYDAGHRYSEFTTGDKVARYGLTALITGTAATAALKAGLLRRLLAPLIGGFLALITIVKRWFGGHKRITANETTTAEVPPSIPQPSPASDPPSPNASTAKPPKRRVAK